MVADGGYPEPTLKVTRVEPLEDPSTNETATPTFELSVEGEPISVVKDFGAVRIEARTLSASVSFEEDQEDTTTPDSGNDSSGSGSLDDSDDGLLGGVANGIRGFLPVTGGGAVLALLGAGILLTGGLLVRRLFR